METPILTKRQQKNSLSAKKTPAKGLKNVLARPYEVSWSVLRDDKDDALKTLLQTLMPAMKRESPRVPWTQLRKLKKEERQAAREEARLKQGVISPDKDIANSIVMGINGVTRLLEKNDAACVLLDANIQPPFVVKHILTMAEMKDIPAFLVTFLKNVTLHTIGFASAAIALKKVVALSENNHFHYLYKKVAELSKTFPKNVPSKLNFEDIEKNEKSIDDTRISHPEIVDTKESIPNKPYVISTDVYKYRSSRKERVFIPKSSTSSEIIDYKMGDDFITLATDLGSEFDETSSDGSQYKEKRRYIDLHKQVDADNFSKLDFVPMNIETVTEDRETLSEINPATLANNKKHLSRIKVSKQAEKFKKSKNNIVYKSLKVKRLQGNVNRVKATKVPKKRNKK